MTDTIQPGDHVRWQWRTVARPYLHSVTAIVVQIVDSYAEIDYNGRSELVRLDRLVKVRAVLTVRDEDDDDWELALLRGAGG